MWGFARAGVVGVIVTGYYRVYCIPVDTGIGVFGRTPWLGWIVFCSEEWFVSSRWPTALCSGVGSRVLVLSW